ncbi:MAG: ABC transporter permease [Candidatus Zambryskibacteria bacterium]|nr:ABC transporter permease [Candidatus Zambryskibacteria bacterium]
MFLAFKQSIKALRANPGRTALTMLGIIIGIGTVILVLSAGAGFRSLIDAQVATLGSDTVFIQVRVPPTTKNRAASSSQSGLSSVFTGVIITSFKQRDLDDIKKLPNVINDYGIVTGQTVVVYRDNKKSAIYYGAGAERFEIDKTKLAKGRFWTQSEDNGGANVAILGDTIAKDLFGQDDPLGKLFRLGTQNFQVIGVYTPQGALSESDNIVFIPITTAQKKLLGIDYMLVGIVELQDVNKADSTVEQIKILLRRNHSITDPVKDDFTVQTQAQALETFNVIFDGITYLLIAIAAISLIVGGVGIMNIMYVVVTERTAEIGLKKALGARESDILNEFLMEAVLVTLLGGVVGIGFGAFLGWVVSVVASNAHLAWTYSVPLYAIILGFGVSATIGIFFGVFPARSAARMDPIEALRYE